MSSSLFSFGDVKNHPSRSGFDVGARRLFTAKAGQLLPAYWDLLLPGTTVNLKDIHFTRTMPVNTAAFTRVKEYIDWYFVPLRLINKNLPPALVNMVDQSNIASSLVLPKQVTTYIPYFSGKNLTMIFDDAVGSTESGPYLDVCRYHRIPNSVRLLRYLRYGKLFYNKKTPGSSIGNNYGYSSVQSYEIEGYFNLNYNVLPLAAYQKIYCDHYRFEQWEKAQPYTYNFDYYSGQDILTPYINDSGNSLVRQDNLFTLRYCNYPKDMFMGLLPSSQLGDVATVNITGVSPVVDSYNGAGVKVGAQITASAGSFGIAGDTKALAAGHGLSVNLNGSSSTAHFDVLAFRVAQATQRYREVAQCAGQGYKEQLEAHWNVKLSNALSDHCIYIGGNSSQIAISEVVNQSVAGDTPADIKGKGIGSGQGSETFTTDEHGILMAMYHAVPVLDYEIDGPDLRLLSTLATDLPQSEFDSLGLESLPVFSIFNSAAIKDLEDTLSVNFPFGFGSRYLPYKTQIDTVDGAFLTSLKSWVAPLTSNYQIARLFDPSANKFGINYSFFKVNPNILDSIFVQSCTDAVDTDQFLVQAYFDVKKVQNLDYNGMPY